MGIITEHKYLTALNQSRLQTYLWKVKFIRKTDSGPVTTEAVFTLKVVKIDGRYYVWNFFLNT
jgi:hypothetical protein